MVKKKLAIERLFRFSEDTSTTARKKKNEKNDKKKERKKERKVYSINIIIPNDGGSGWLVRC